MATNLDLDQLSEVMRAQQEGNSNGKNLVWDRTTLGFVEQDVSEPERSGQCVVNPAADGGFFLLVTEKDFGHPVFYIDGQELNDFLKSDELECEGVGYEWENEGVTHLHFRAINHSFGISHSVSFAKQNGKHCCDASIKVDIKENGDAFINNEKVNVIPSVENLYKRNKGLLELDILAGKKVLIIGLGSGGSPIAVELAKAGVGQFAIVDFDRIELHNLSRHICTLNDLGRLKTDAVTDEILGKNPYAIINKLPIDINKNKDIIENEIKKTDIVFCCTDNNQSRYLISELLVKYDKIGIFGRAITRAEGGDVFIYRPGGPCYFCLHGSNWYDPTTERPVAYADADTDAVVQIGLGADIEPISNMMVKLALMELSRGSDSGISSLENEFCANYYIWANRRDRQYTNWGSFHNTDGMPTIMKWYGVNITKDDKCPVCGNSFSLQDEGSLKSLEAMGSSNFEGLSLKEIDSQNQQ